MSKQVLITVFDNFKTNGNTQHQIPEGYRVAQIVSSAVQNTNPSATSSAVFPRIAITMLCEKI